MTAVNHKLLFSGVATLIPESMGLRNSKGEVVTQSDHIILDRRPLNELEASLGKIASRFPPYLTNCPKGIQRVIQFAGVMTTLATISTTFDTVRSGCPVMLLVNLFMGKGTKLTGGGKREKVFVSFPSRCNGRLECS